MVPQHTVLGQTVAVSTHQQQCLKWHVTGRELDITSSAQIHAGEVKNQGPYLWEEEDDPACHVYCSWSIYGYWRKLGVHGPTICVHHKCSSAAERAAKQHARSSCHSPHLNTPP